MNAVMILQKGITDLLADDGRATVAADFNTVLNMILAQPRTL